MLLLTQLVRHQALTPFASTVAAAITQKTFTPSFERAQADADLAAGAEQTRASCMGLTDQLDRLAPVNGTGQPSAFSEQKADHFFRSANKGAISAMAFSLSCSSFCSFKVTTGFSLATYAACRQCSICSGNRGRSRQ